MRSTRRSSSPIRPPGSRLGWWRYHAEHKWRSTPWSRCPPETASAERSAAAKLVGGRPRDLRVAIGASPVDQCVDHAAALVGFRMPLDAEHEPARRRFDRLRQLIDRRVAGHLEALPDPVHPLMMV